MRWIAGLLAALLVGCASREIADRDERRFPPEPQIATAPAAAGPVWPETAPAIYADSAIVIDAVTGRTLYQKNADVRRQVASTQKLLTALLVAERGGLEEPVTIAASDTRVEPTNLGMRAGDSYVRGRLLAAMLVKSCNDVAEALARDYSGNSSLFAGEMNRRAFELGARNSFFLNAHGLPAAQFSTARDMARIAYAAYRNPVLRQFMRLPGMTFVLANGRTRYLEATNKLLKRSGAFDGMKTGYTNAAGRCLVSSASMGGRAVILVQLGSKTSRIFNDAEDLMLWALQ